jgi:hypothetical protein
LKKQILRKCPEKKDFFIVHNVVESLYRREPFQVSDFESTRNDKREDYIDSDTIDDDYIDDEYIEIRVLNGMSARNFSKNKCHGPLISVERAK